MYLKYYYGSKIDSQGRILLGKYAKDLKKIVFYVDDEQDNLVFIEPYSKDSGLPSECARSVDEKGRVCLPKWIVGKHNRVLIGSKDGAVVLKLI